MMNLWATKQTNCYSLPEPTRTPYFLHFDLCKTGGANPPWTVNYIYLAFYPKEQTVYRSWRVREIRGDRICFYISEGWCIDVTVLKKICCPHLQTLFINGKPFYSPQEFPYFYSAQCYIPPQACVSEALQRLIDQITSMEQEHPGTILIILGDFNRANLSNELHKYRQYNIKYLGTGTHCHTVLKDTYSRVPDAAFKLSDHLSCPNLLTDTKTHKACGKHCGEMEQ